MAPGALLEQGGPLGSVGPADLARGHIVEVFYYSFVTLTTLGRGRIDLLASLTAEPRPLVKLIRVDQDKAAAGRDASIASYNFV